MVSGVFEVADIDDDVSVARNLFTNWLERF
jgi:hypothetical protein